MLWTDDEVLYYYRNCLSLTSMRLDQLQRLKKWLSSVSQPNVAMNGLRSMNGMDGDQSMNDEDHKSWDDSRSSIPLQYVMNGGITFAGFVQLHLVLVQMLQHDCIWKSLERFGYRRADLEVDPNVVPTVPDRTAFSQFVAVHNPILRPKLKELMAKHSKSRLQYELSPSIAGFLISIFTPHCSNPHDEHNAMDHHHRRGPVHEFSTCFVTGEGLKRLLAEYHIAVPFHGEDFDLVGGTAHSVTLTAWLSLWALLMYYETEMALRCLMQMGAPTLFPSMDCNPKWHDYAVPQITCSPNVHQRFFNCLVVTYPFNKVLVHQFVRSSVDDFSRSDELTRSQGEHLYHTFHHLFSFTVTIGIGCVLPLRMLTRCPELRILIDWNVAVCILSIA